MTDIADAKSLIQEEETRFRAPTSESMFTRVGGSINFINNRQNDSHHWNLNGRYSVFPIVGPDGVFGALFDIEIVGYLFYGGLNTGSGTTIIDVHRLTGGNTDVGSIFSTRPTIAVAAADDTYSFYRETDSTTLALPTGHTLGVFSVTELDAGDALRLDLDSSMSGGQNAQFTILYRPR